MTGLSLLLVAAATCVDFGWQPQPDGNLEYVIQIAPSQVELLKSGQIVINDIPPDVRGGRSFVLKVGAGDVPRQGRVAPPAPNGGLGQGAGLVGRTAGPSTARQIPRFAPIPGPVLQPEPTPAGNPPPIFAQPAGAEAPLPGSTKPVAAPALLPGSVIAGGGAPPANQALRGPELAAPVAPQNAPLQPIPAAQPGPAFGQPNPALQPNPAFQPAPVAFPNAAPPAQPNFAQPNLGQPNLVGPNFAQPNFPQPNVAQPNFPQPNFNQPVAGQPNFVNPAPPVAVADPRWNDPRVAAGPELPAVVARPGNPVPAAQPAGQPNWNGAPVAAQPAGPWPQFPQGAPPRDDSLLLVPVGQNGVAAAPTRPPQVEMRGQPWEPVAQDPRFAQQPGIGVDPRFDPIQPRGEPWQRRWDDPPAGQDDNFNGPTRNDADARWANARWDGSRWTTPRANRSDNPIRDTSFRSRNGNNGPNREFPEDGDRFAGDPNDRWQNDPNDRWQDPPSGRYNTIPVGYAPNPSSGLSLGALDALRVDRNGTGVMLSTGKTPVSSTPSKVSAAAAAAEARDQSWMPWTITTLGLFLSIGANMYLWWIWSDAHRRYLMLIAEMRGART